MFAQPTESSQVSQPQDPVATQPDQAAKKVIDPRRAESVSKATSLIFTLTIVLLVIGTVAILILMRARRRALGEAIIVAKKRRARADAWSEAGRRAEPIAPEEFAADQDTVDIDPNDFSAGDVDPEAPRNGGGGGRNGGGRNGGSGNGGGRNGGGSNGGAGGGGKPRDGRGGGGGRGR